MPVGHRAGIREGADVAEEACGFFHKEVLFAAIVSGEILVHGN